MLEYGTGEMKTKLLFWSAILFLALGLNTTDGTLFYFFSIHHFMLFVGISIHKRAYKPNSETAVEPLPATGPAEK
jgi:hypothetical protein